MVRISERVLYLPGKCCCFAERHRKGSLSVTVGTAGGSGEAGQELLAPSIVEAYSPNGVRLDDRSSPEALVHASTGIQYERWTAQRFCITFTGGLCPCL